MCAEAIWQKCWRFWGSCTWVDFRTYFSRVKEILRTKEHARNFPQAFQWTPKAIECCKHLNEVEWPNRGLVERYSWNIRSCLYQFSSVRGVFIFRHLSDLTPRMESRDYPVSSIPDTSQLWIAGRWCWSVTRGPDQSPVGELTADCEYSPDVACSRFSRPSLGHTNSFPSFQRPRCMKLPSHLPWLTIPLSTDSLLLGSHARTQYVSSILFLQLWFESLGRRRSHSWVPEIHLWIYAYAARHEGWMGDHSGQ